MVILWGHGGKQGPTPVFHVRGQRLTATDVAALAAKLSAVPSRWILMFRGSGSFARALRGPGREILSSDYETTFSNDPAGMSLLIRLARTQPALAFTKLAEQFGRVTADWYSERKLAQTEEPTLWLEENEPRLLAQTQSNPNALGEVNAEQRNDSATDVASRTGTNEPGPSLATPPLDEPTKDAGQWTQMKRVSRDAYPSSDGVVLCLRQVCMLGNNPAIVTEREEFIQVLTPEGKRFGDFDISFAPPHEELEFLDCEVLQPNGQVARMDPEGLRTAGERPLGEYQPTRRKFFSLPGVVPGAVLHVRYRSQWKEYPMPRVSMVLPLARELPVVDSSVEVRLPKEVPLHFCFEGVSAPEPALRQTTYARSYTWHLPQLAPATLEPLSNPHRHASLLLSTFADWQAFGDWYAHISKLAAEGTDEIATKARELTRDAKTPREKVEALYNYVASLRYVAVPLGVNSLRPHAAANVLQNQFGDCKDKANLLNALLHASNIEADLVLAPRFSQAREEVPGLAFNHAISRVKLADETLWLDTTDEVCRFGLLPPGDASRNVLVVDGRTTNLTRLAMPEPSQHRLTIHGKLCSGGPASGWPLTLIARGSGYADYQLRSSAQSINEHGGALPLLAARFRPVAGSFALEHQSATPVSALDRDFTWQAEGTGIGLVTEAEAKCVLHSPFWLPKEWDIALNRRSAALFLNEGYPLTIDEEFEIGLVPGTAGYELPAKSENLEEPLRWRMEWTQADNAKLVARLHAELVRGELSLPETSAFQRQLRELLASLASDASLSLPASEPKVLNTSQN
jgi:hypothetical protein